MDDLIEPSRPPRPGRQHVLVKTLRKNATTAKNGVAMKTACLGDDPNRSIGNGQVR